MEYLLLSLTGLLAGVLGGMLGLGGSVIMIPLMVWILGARVGGREQIHQYQAAAMIVNFLVALPALVAHARKRAIWWRVWAYLAATALVGMVLGVQLARLFLGDAAIYLRWLVGAFFVYVAGQNILRLLRPPRQEGLPQAEVEAGPAWRKLAVGLPAGLLAGLLGIGGGAVAVPAQQAVLKVPLRNAIATSVALIASIAWLGAILKNVHLGAAGSVARSLELAACLAPTAMIGSYLGGLLTHRLDLRIVRAVFAALMALSAAKLLAG